MYRQYFKHVNIHTPVQSFDFLGSEREKLKA